MHRSILRHMWPDYCESCSVTQRHAVLLIFSTKLWGLHLENERWGGAGLEVWNCTSEILVQIQENAEAAPTYTTVHISDKTFFHLFVSPSPSVYFSSHSCFLPLGCLSLSVFLSISLSLSLSATLLLPLSLFLSPCVCLSGRHTLLQLGCKKLWSTCQESNGAANSQIGTQRARDAYTHTHSHTRLTNTHFKMVPVPQKEKTAQWDHHTDSI